ncbi:hypothetical protein HAZT_HAZT011442 [Hyalella azteca]|nr:hypothetical protein HAZT_HAZT011442 [Hyalella azteca]
MAFKVSSSDSDFNSRVNDLFSSLNNVEKTLPQDGLVFESSTSGLFHRDKFGNLAAASATFDGSFKRPNESNIPQKKRLKGSNIAPDYEKHPENWTCYSMKDTEVLDNAQNKEACLQLLADLRRNKAAEDCEMIDLDKEKIIFKKPQIRTAATDVSREDPEKQDSGIASDVGGSKKFVMAEHVVGVAKKKKKKSDKSQNSHVKSDRDRVNLSYLQFDDGEDCN